MSEIAKKADSALLEKIQNGSVSINKVHEMIKAAEAKKKAEVPEEVSDEKSCNTGKGINSESFSFLRFVRVRKRQKEKSDFERQENSKTRPW